MKVISIKERKDGSATMTYTLNKREESMLKKEALKQKKMYSKRFINATLLKALRDGMELEKTQKTR